MKRDTFEDLLSRGLDGELDAAERQALDRRLAEEPALRNQAEAWRRYGDWLREPAPGAPTPEAMWADVQRALRQAPAAPAPSPWRTWGLRWAAAAAGLALAAVAGWRLIQPGAAARETGGAHVEWVETDLPGASPMVYEDAESGWVVIWVAGVADLANGAKGG